MTYTKNMFDEFVANLKAKDKLNPKPSPRIKLAGIKGRKRYYRGEFVGTFPDGTSYHYKDLTREGLVPIFDEILANMKPITF